MGWFQRLLGKESRPDLEEAHSFHVYDLVEWLNSSGQEIITQHNLAEEAEQYVSALKQKRTYLESNLYIWQQRIPVNDVELRSIISDVRSIITLLSFSPNPTVSSLLTMHARLEPQLREVQKEIEKNHAVEILFHEPDQDSTGNPLLQALQEISSLQEAFEIKVIDCGFTKVFTLIQKATVLEDTADAIRQFREQLQKKKEQLTSLEEKKKEKELELNALQQHSLYSGFKAIKDSRTQLLADLEHSDVSRRFEIRQQLDVLEKGVGSKDFIFKMDEAHYRLEHFAQQVQKAQEEADIIQDNLSAQLARQERETDLFTNLVKLSLGKEIRVKF